MAEQKQDIDVVEAAPKRSRLLILGVLVSVLVIAAAVAWVWLSGDGAANEDASSTTAPETAPAIPASTQRGEALYFDFADPFIVNFTAQSQGQVRYLKIEMQVMSRQAAAIQALTQHKPALQHALLLELYRQNYDDLSSNSGQEALATSLVQVLNELLTSLSGLEQAVEQVFFSNLVMQ